MEDAHEEGEGVLPDDGEVDSGQEDGSVDEESDHDGDHVHPQLPGNCLQVVDGDDLTADQTGDTEGRVPDGDTSTLVRGCWSRDQYL